MRLADLFRRGARRNPLEEYFRSNPGRQIHKWDHYFEIYHRHLERFRRRSPVVVEIGVDHGGSLQMWREYFGRGARIVGIDIDPECRAAAGEQIAIEIGDQGDRAFLAALRGLHPRVDVVIDDGGHRMEQQVTAFEELYPHVQPEGVYICEDLHTSYRPDFGGGLRREGTFVEHAKTLVDRLHAWHQPGAADAFARSTFALHFYEGMLVVEKRPVVKPTHSRTGEPLLVPQPRS